MLKMLSSLHITHRYISQLTVSLKATGTTILSLTAHQTPAFTGNSFITKFTLKFSPTRSSRSIFHVGEKGKVVPVLN
jgi:hypothetical protein